MVKPKASNLKAKKAPSQDTAKLEQDAFEKGKEVGLKFNDNSSEDYTAILKKVDRADLKPRPSRNRQKQQQSTSEVKVVSEVNTYNDFLPDVELADSER
jgi:hypothetical protein